MRAATFNRRTTETQIRGRLVIDGKGRYDVSTGIRFLDHMLELFARHGGFDLKLRASGDLDVDQHHTVEDVGITLGASALSLALCVLVGGVVADRLPRQLTMLGSDVVRGVTQAVAAVLLLTDRASVASLAALMLVYGAAEAFFRPAMLGLVPQVVERGEEQPANALLAVPKYMASLGLFQPISDVLKLLTKEDFTPPFVNKALFIAAPAIIVVTALIGPQGLQWD